MPFPERCPGTFPGTFPEQVSERFPSFPSSGVSRVESGRFPGSPGVSRVESGRFPGSPGVPRVESGRFPGISDFFPEFPECLSPGVVRALSGHLSRAFPEFPEWALFPSVSRVFLEGMHAFPLHI